MDLEVVDKLLTTTRSVRKRLDLARPVPPELIAECLEIAVQAPTGSNMQGWSFVVVTDAAKKRQIRDLYKQGFDGYRKLREGGTLPSFDASDPRAERMPAVLESATFLAEHMHEVPVLLIPCVEGRVEHAGVMAQASVYGSILPAVWSFMLAARARGLGSAWTTLHLAFEKEVAKLLEIPETVTQTALLPVAYFKGADFRRAQRIPAQKLCYWDRWGARR